MNGSEAVVLTGSDLWLPPPAQVNADGQAPEDKGRLMGRQTEELEIPDTPPPVLCAIVFHYPQSRKRGHIHRPQDSTYDPVLWLFDLASSVMWKESVKFL